MKLNKREIRMTKGNDGSGNIKERDYWETPQWLFDILNKQYKFDLDCCANRKNRKVGNFCNNFLRFPHGSMYKCVWMNPPFSKANEIFEYYFEKINGIKSGVCIYRCDNMETRIWQYVILKNATWIFIPKGRICYEGMEGKGSRFPSALIGLNVEPPKGLNGFVLNIQKKEKSK